MEEKATPTWTTATHTRALSFMKTRFSKSVSDDNMTILTLSKAMVKGLESSGLDLIPGLSFS